VFDENTNNPVELDHSTHDFRVFGFKYQQDKVDRSVYIRAVPKIQRHYGEEKQSKTVVSYFFILAMSSIYFVRLLSIVGYNYF
jgi:hypothetical protein